MAGNQVRFKAQLDDQVSGKLGKIRDQFDRLGKSKGAMSVLQGVGMGAGISAWNLLGGAVSKTTDFLGDSIQAAIDEEAGVARLNAALAANIKGWDGSTEAIERGIAARVDMGFTDDELRDSMAQLVTMTRSVETAQRAQAAAMDLARYKGIDLADASGAIGKAMAGNKRMLKELGIATEDAGDAWETLGEIEKAVHGQSAKFAETTAGRIEAAKARIDGFMGDVGADVVEGADKIGLSLDFIGYTLTHLEANQDLEQTFYDWVQGLEEVKAASSATAAVLSGDLYTATTLTADTIGELRAAYPPVADAADDLADSVITSNRQITRSYAGVADYLLGEYNEDFDRAMGITEARADLHNAKNAADRAQAYQDLAELGAISQKDLEAWGRQLDKLVATSTGKAREAFKAARDEYNRYRAALSRPITVRVNYVSNDTDLGGGTGVGHRASGGQASGLTWVGEQGPELVDLGASSYVYTARQSQAIAAGAAGGGGMVPVSIPIVIDGREIARVVDKHLYYEAARAPRSSYAG